MIDLGGHCLLLCHFEALVWSGALKVVLWDALLVVEMLFIAVYVGVLFGTFNSTIPNLSDVEYDSFGAGCISEDIESYLEGLWKGLVLNIYDEITAELLGVLLCGIQVCV